jgi:hypothetical protein
VKAWLARWHFPLVTASVLLVLAAYPFLESGWHLVLIGPALVLLALSQYGRWLASRERRR